MKPISFFCCFLFFCPFCLFSQDSLAVFTVSTANAAAYNNAGSVVSAVKMNVLYIGVENTIDISVPGIAAKDITAAINNDGTIYKSSDGHFTAQVTKTGVSLISVKVKGKEVSRHAFRVKRIPDPVASINGKFGGGNVSAGSLREMTGVVVLLRDFDFNSRFNVTGFTFVHSSAGAIRTIAATGPMFTQEMKNSMSRAKSGDIIIVDQITIIGPDSMPRNIGNLTFIVL